MRNYFLNFQVVLGFGLIIAGIALGVGSENYGLAGIFAFGGFIYFMVWRAVRRYMNSD
jgi:hypothetical protein